MNQPTSFELFDLLARSWPRPARATAAVFNRDLSAVAFPAEDGTVALAGMDDPESPLARVHTSGDVGRHTIRPRKRDPRPLIATAGFADAAPPVAAYGASDFLVGGADGGVIRLGVDGESAPTPLRTDGAVVGLATVGTLVAATDGASLMVDDLRAGEPHAPAVTGAGIGALAFDGAGRRLAFAAGEGVTILDVTARDAGGRTILLPGRPTAVVWGGGDRWIAAPLSSGGFALIEVETGRFAHIADFPAAVGAVSFAPRADVVIAAGAYRVAGWSLAAPPIDDKAEGAIRSGRAGLVIVTSVAAHPERPIAAVGHADGQIALAQIGDRGEMLIRTAGAAVRSLVWSADGDHLAVTCDDGSVAVATFPPQLFK